MIGVGLIGYGYWGPNLARNIADCEALELVAVCDQNVARLALAKSRYPAIRATSDAEELISASDVDVVVVATPVWAHFDLAMRALQAGKHTFVEKPLASSVEQASRLVEEASRRGRMLHVDHTFVYTGAVRKIKDLLDNHAIGRLYYYDSVRVNLGLFQHDINVLWDLAVHDLAIMDYLVGRPPASVSAAGMAHLPGQPENIAFLTCAFDQSLIAHFHVNWLAPVKIRRTLIGGESKMIVFDDLEPSEKIKVYDKGVELNASPEDIYRMRVGYRSGDMWAPQLDLTEALRVEMDHFAECVIANRATLTDGEAGLRVVRILEKAGESLRDRSRMVDL